MSSLGRLATVSICALLLSGCNPFYVMRAAYEEAKILARREPITEVIEAGAVSEEQKEKLQLVLDARAFAIQMGLNPEGAFTYYSKVDRDPLVWVLVGAERDAFALYTWWYPIVGTVPYKGFFDKEDSISAAKQLEDKGLETWIRGAEAFSTLGWFDDPVVSTTLKNDVVRIANTVIHESVHSTIWFSSQVAFDESMANYIGSKGALDFFKARLAHCQNSGLDCAKPEQLKKTAEVRFVQELELGRVVTKVYEDLNELYESELSREEKLAQRVEVFNSAMAPTRAKWPKLEILKELNNAEVIQLKLYLTKLELFDALHKQYNEDWPKAVAALQDLHKEYESKDDQDPFELLAARNER